MTHEPERPASLIPDTSDEGNKEDVHLRIKLIIEIRFLYGVVLAMCMYFSSYLRTGKLI